MERTNQKIGMWIIIIATIIPALLVCNFMPDWNIFPYWLCVAVSGFGASIGTVVYTKQVVHGAIAGLLIGCGVILGIQGYVLLRPLLIDSARFFSFELLLGAAVGAIPGMVYYRLVTPKRV